MTPDFKSRKNVYCVAGCRQIVRSDDIDVCGYKTLRHKTKSLIGCICRRCEYNARKMQQLNEQWEITP